MPWLAKATRERIVGLLKEGNSPRDVAIQFNRSPCVVGSLRKTVSNIGSGSKGSRPSKLTLQLRRQTIHDITNETHGTPKQVAAALKEAYSISATPQIVRNFLRQAGLKAWKKVKKPALTSRRRKS
ncbi:hypothetical protein K3495_g14906 [Podosphaera aphanis]|nr:hypothetical protein K3495_g14906 [Podosphaera aphanis]